MGSPRIAWLAAVLLLVTLVGCDPKPPARSSVTVMSWNICGGNPEGCVDRMKDEPDGYQGSPQGKADAVADAVKRRSVVAFTLQEACTTHVRALRAHPDLAGWTIGFAPVGKLYDNERKVKPSGCTIHPEERYGEQEGELYGVIVAFRGEAEQSFPREPYPIDRVAAGEPRPDIDPSDLLPSPGGKEEQRAVLCLRQASTATQLCGTHFSKQGDPIRKEQADRLGDLMRDGERDGFRSIAGGDLNSETGSEKLRALDNAGEECDEKDDEGGRGGKADEATDGKHLFGRTYYAAKIDHLFTMEGGWAACRVDQFAGDEYAAIHYSDHWQLIGTLAAWEPGPISTPDPSRTLLTKLPDDLVAHLSSPPDGYLSETSGHERGIEIELALPPSPYESWEGTEPGKAGRTDLVRHASGLANIAEELVVVVYESEEAASVAFEEFSVPTSLRAAELTSGPTPLPNEPAGIWYGTHTPVGDTDGWGPTTTTIVLRVRNAIVLDSRYTATTEAEEHRTLPSEQLERALAVFARVCAAGFGLC